jgi:shikimate dehydrogenase
MIRGTTRLIAHLGYPTDTFTAPMIYNPFFEAKGIDAVVVPMGVKADALPQVLAALRSVTNFHGALITMPHKVAVVALLDAVTTAVEISGSCNAVRREADGTLSGDMFDGAGFVRGAARKGCRLAGARALVVGSGGVGCAIAAALAEEGVHGLGLHDVNETLAHGLAARLHRHYPGLEIETGNNDPTGWDIVINATPLGMKPFDPLPVDAALLDATSFVGDVVLGREITPFLSAARLRGCSTQTGLDMLFEQIPAYLEFFGFPTTTPSELRAIAKISY